MKPSPNTALLALPVTERVSPQARSIRVEVHPDGGVVLVIPRFVPKRLAYEFLHSREEWIRRKQAELQNRPRAPLPRPPKWDGSDRMLFRGVETPLLLVPSHGTRPRVRLDAAIALYCAPARTTAAQRVTAVRKALAEAARCEALKLLEAEAARLDVSFRGPRIADQRSLWGSCAPSGLISLNWRLIQAPPEVLRYVIVHELCHRRHLNHSRRFWNLVLQQMPDFETWRGWLRVHGGGLHAVLPKPGRGGPAPAAEDAL